ncbi:MAG: aldo/keto reductase [Bacteroidales bacterium]|nr:aldo/keto reductase [Bacteroidales bacterium]
MNKKMFNRRKFLKAGAITALGAGLAPGLNVAGETKQLVPEKTRIKEYRKFGRTGFEVSDISSGNPSNEAVLKALLKSGVNLIDTGEAYNNGNSERLIGRVIKDFDRRSIFINSKLYTEKQFPSKQEVINRTNQCLERLQTDYVDCIQIHSAENTAILKDEAFHSAMEQLKKEGKVRHLGVSCHGSNWAYDTEESLDKIMMSAIEDGRFDVLLFAYNFLNAEITEKILNACEQKNIATMIMKSNPVYIYGLMQDRMTKLSEEGKEADEYTRAFYDKYKIMNDNALDFFSEYGISGEKEILEAASKYVLSNTKAHTTLWDFRNFDDINNMLRLSGEKLTKKDTLVLKGYQKHLGHLSCRIGCNECQAACPHHLPVNKILRYNYYFSVKKQEKRAISKFARLNSKKPTEVCTGCDGYCEKACRYGVSTRSLLALAQQNMELMV